MPLYLVSRNDTRQRASFAECRGRTLGKINGSSRPLAGVGGLPSGELCRVSNTMQKLLCRVLFFAEYPTLSKKAICRVPHFAECPALGKKPLYQVSFFAECCTRQTISLQSACYFALGKYICTRQRTRLRQWYWLAKPEMHLVTQSNPCRSQIRPQCTSLPWSAACRF